MAKTHVSTSINGEPVEFLADPGSSLLDALRNTLGLTGTKEGCGTGDCGACTVDIDGQAVMSCQVTLGACEGAGVTTIEGLSPDRSHPVQLAWIAEQVTQCGFCDPGFIMAIAALLRRNPDPSDAEIAALPNLCRCGTYPRARLAIARARRIMSGEERAPATAAPGTRLEEAMRAVPALRPGR